MHRFESILSAIRFSHAEDAALKGGKNRWNLVKYFVSARNEHRKSCVTLSDLICVNEIYITLVRTRWLLNWRMSASLPGHGSWTGKWMQDESRRPWQKWHYFTSLNRYGYISNPGKILWRFNAAWRRCLKKSDWSVDQRKTYSVCRFVLYVCRYCSDSENLWNAIHSNLKKCNSKVSNGLSI